MMSNTHGPEQVAFVAGEPVMQSLRDGVVDILAQASETVLIEGEHGTGKHHLARFIHSASGRSGRLIVAEVASIPTESDKMLGVLFGSPNPSVDWLEGKTGLFQGAHDGTLLFDGIDDAPLSLQESIVVPLSMPMTYRIAADREVELNVRIITTSRHDLRQFVDKGTFRKDLYHRLTSFVISLPPLRERRGDVYPLVGHFMSRFGHEPTGPDSDLVDKVCRLWSKRSWPGNVRQLEMEVSRICAVSEGDPARLLTLAEKFGPED